ncbi:Maltose/galactoside acetyltransferase [Penicillium hispanicum]|uniref:Maltose/galactoside acetyltransferase n=1 Tax=Penicillium hispanicum TaxID=1080232 RepID=UPI00253F8ACB|nr:Maltose/galactoside acetyltransferase [Penicillium hispanicum]KAJ5587946.1 Maltose/galactoside acetyltransferase [Penicillium hispanicum]
MTAVASAPVMSNHDSGTETGTEHSPSRFTAVNGRDASSASGANVGNPLPITQPATGDRRGSPETHEALRQDKLAEREDYDQDDQLSPRSSLQGTVSQNRHKRKRSDSGGQESRHNSEPRGVGRDPSRLDDFSAHPNSNGAGSGSVSEIEPGHPPTSGHRSDTNEPSQSASNGPWIEYDSHLITQAQRAQQIDASDVELVDALQREAQTQESASRNIGANRLTSSAPSVQPAPSPAYSSERQTAAVQVAPKRKRVFSNRTKTGCMTCRRRKKKCDEQHPACESSREGDFRAMKRSSGVNGRKLIISIGNNCIRGGFLCEGYTSRSTWQKPSSSKAPVLLQSKEGYPEISGQYLPETAQHHDRQPSLAEHIDSRKMRPVVIEDVERPTPQYNTSPTGAGSSHPSWSKRGWPSTGHPTYPSEHLAKADYREVPPIHEPSREGPPKPEYPVVQSIRELPPGPHPKANIALFQGGVEPRPLPTAPIDTNSPQAQARMALSIEHQLSGRATSGDDTEKDKMIRGDLYRPFDVQLVEDRDRCKGALWRFNNACNPLNGLGSKEQNRLLKEILVPPSSSAVNSPAGVAGCRAAGSIGQGAVVEAPFSCHYGYNIHLGEDVMVSHNCVFVDDSVISVGAHTWIGPNVTILSSMAHASMQERKGSQSRYQGRRVTIEEDCYIGAGCTIYPGVSLGRGTYIAPGEVVKQNIVPYGFQGFKPSYM